MKTPSKTNFNHNLKTNLKGLCRGFIFGTALIGVLALSLPFALAQTAFDDPALRAQAGAGVAGGTLVPVTADVDGGTLQIGNSAQVVMRFRNESNEAISIKETNLYESSNVTKSIKLNQCAQEALPAGAECAIIITVRAQQDGDYRIEALIRHTGPSRLTTAVISGSIDTADTEEEGLITTDISPLPNNIDFDTLTASRPIIRSVTLRNVTSNQIDIKNLYIDAPAQSGFSLRTDCASLMPAEACIASITWSPIVQGPTSGFLVVEHSGQSRVTNVSITGEFTPDAVSEAEIFPSPIPGKGLLVSNITEVDFGSDVSSISAITLSLVNAGDADLLLTNINLSTTDNGLRIVKKGCVPGHALEPTAACPLTLIWSPSREGSLLDDVQIEHTGARGILVLPVRGTATESVSLDSQPLLRIEGIDEDNLIDPTPSLDGFVVTSLSGTHAIVSGPGGTRVLKSGQDVFIGGVQWKPEINSGGVSLTSGMSQVMLVFDRSFSTRSAAGGSAIGNTAAQ
jgi:hypothetical protein